MTTDPLDGRGEVMDPRPFTLPCCTHQVVLDRVLSELAIAHGRSLATERTAQGLDRTERSTHHAPENLFDAALIALSKWLDGALSGRDLEAITLHRLIKVAEEGGEVVSAFIGYSGSNPRKGVTNGLDKVLDELLDVAVTVLGAYEHLDGHRGHARAELDRKIIAVATRAGLITTPTKEQRP